MLQEIFSPDNRVMIFITKIVYSVYLNILWFICCIPIVTAGASTTALFYVTLKMAKNEEGSITVQFFRAFRQNFKYATKVWLIMLAVGVVLGIDGYVLYHMRFENALWTVVTAVFLVAVAAYLIIAMYIFPLMARFDNTVRRTFLNSIILGMRFLYCTALMALIYFVMAVIVINIFTPAIVFGEGLCAFFCSYLLTRILEMLAPKNEEDEASEENPDTEEIPEGMSEEMPEENSDAKELTGKI